MSKVIDAFCYTLHAVHEAGKPLPFVVSPHPITRPMLCKMVRLCHMQYQIHFGSLSNIERELKRMNDIKMVIETIENHLCAISEIENSIEGEVYVISISGLKGM